MITQIKLQVTTQQFIFYCSITGVICIATGLVLLGKFYQNKMFANTYINSINVSGLTLEKSLSLLNTTKEELEPHEFVLSIDDIQLASTSADLGYATDYLNTVTNAYIEQHNQNSMLTALLAVQSLFKKNMYKAPKTYDINKLDSFLSHFNQKVELIGKNPSVEQKISGSENSIIIYPGKPGRTVNAEQTTKNILESINSDEYSATAEIASTSSVLSQEAMNNTLQRAKTLVGKKVVLTSDDTKFYLTDQDMVSFINPVETYYSDKIVEFFNTLAEKINREPQNAEFEYDSQTLQVTKFVPHKDGLQLNVDENVAQTVAWLSKVEKASEKTGETDNNNNESNNSENIKGISSSGTEFGTHVDVLPISMLRVKPATPLENTNDLGIVERIGFGESYYYHSIPNRIHNVGITAKKMDLTIIPPGNEFSFNKILGDVSAKTGYKPAYVISGGKTVLGDGGGVCQVSSTTFRAALDAGLDITKRLQHAYRVSYYELNSDPGFDATVYSGDIDFRFINDTDNHILLAYTNDPENLYLTVEIYGTNDGRTSEISNYKKWGATNALPTEYFPTNELPTGVKKQVDWAVGGIKTEFTHTVKDKDGKIIHNDTYYSNYRPWSAKYMVGI